MRISIFIYRSIYLHLSKHPRLQINIPNCA
uniref:Uncharacterized protein n=1 Tax=Arundo donax TaxID=35708 RepID=A0A0A9D9H0_ARUDO